MNGPSDPSIGDSLDRLSSIGAWYRLWEEGYSKLFTGSVNEMTVPPPESVLRLRI